MNGDRQFLKPGRTIPHKNVKRVEENQWQSGTRHFFYERAILVTSNFRWVHLSVCIIFYRLCFYVFGTNFIGFLNE